MRKMICMLVLFFVASDVFANIIINLKNVKNNKNVFILSLVDAKKIYATNAGSVAIIPDEKLRNYSTSSDFAIGLDDEIITQYCVASLEHSSQFFFSYSNKDVIRKTIQLEMKKNVPVCSNM